MAALAGCLVYANSLGNGFALDDLRLVRDNADIREFASFPRLFLLPYWSEGGEASGLYRPLTIVSFAWNRALTGDGPPGFHLVNVLLHGAVCALVWFAARRASRHYGTALAAALLFAVHPLHTEAVANVAGRAELLAALGVVAAWLLHRRAAEASVPGERTSNGVAAAACYLAALLSKEGAALAPLLFLLDERCPGGERPRPRAARWIWLAYAGAAAAALLLRIGALGGLRGVEDYAFLDNPAAAAGTGVRLATALWVLARYAGLFVWPATLSSDYSFAALPPVEAWTDPRWIAGLALASGVIALGVAGWRRSRVLCLSSATTVLFLLPGANLLFPVGTLMAERLTYLPSLGACLLVGHGAAAVAGDDRGGPAGRVAVIALLSAALLLCGARTWTRNPDWRDNMTLAQRDVLAQPRSAKLHAGAGIALHAAGRSDEAEPHYREALAIYPDYAQVHYNLGELLAARGENRPAVEHLRRAAEISPANPRPLRSLAPLLKKTGDVEGALEAYARVLALEAEDHRLRFDYARALLAEQRWEDAMEQFTHLAENDPDGVPGEVARVLLLDWQGRGDEAIARIREALTRPDLTAVDRHELARLLEAFENRRP